MSITALLTNTAYGFPRGRSRRVTPVALACIHITGNSRTAAYTDVRAAARAERTYANRVGSNGPSAHLYVARDGWWIKAVDWKEYAAWSNGDVLAPNTSNSGIKAVLALKARGFNANEAYWQEFENVGYGSAHPVNDAQKDACAALIYEAHVHSGLPISRATVHGHWELNSVNRSSCPGGRETILNEIIARAKRLAIPPDTSTVGDTVNTYPVPKVPRTATIKTGAWLYVSSELLPNPGNIQLDPGRPLLYFGEPSPGAGMVVYDTGNKAMFVKTSDIVSVQTLSTDDTVALIAANAKVATLTADIAIAYKAVVAATAGTAAAEKTVTALSAELAAFAPDRAAARRLFGL